MNPEIHSKSSVKRWHGTIDNYIQIHEFLDEVKGTMNNNSARMITHNIWFCQRVIPRVFGYNIINSDGKSVDTVDIAMLHVAEDFKMRFVPTVQDYLQHLNVQPWMNGGVKSVDNAESIQNAVTLINKLKK